MPLVELHADRLPFEPSYGDELLEAARSILERRGPGSEMLGWLDLPTRQADEVAAVKRSAAQLRDELDCLVVVGIGGSYLGARALFDAIGGDGPEILFAGHHLEARGFQELRRRLEGRRWGINVISKSGTTTEPAIAFRLLRTQLEREAGDAFARRIVATTDAERGALRQLADDAGFTTFVVPDDVGGRFSVLSPVGLLPLAVAGVDIDALLLGAANESQRCAQLDPAKSPALRYASHRHDLLERGYGVEILASFHPSLHHVAEWWKQLYGESEGKEGKGLFPAAVDYTTDLHSLGQYVQEGRRFLLETFLDVVQPDAADVVVPTLEDSEDGLDYLAGRGVAEINRTALQAVAEAHAGGGVAVQRIEIPALDAESLGSLLFFFEFAVSVSGRLLGVNPFDQPGVEAYKTRLFQLLGRPGY